MNLKRFWYSFVAFYLIEGEKCKQNFTKRLKPFVL